MAAPQNPLARYTDTAENGAGFCAEREGGFAKLTPLTPRARGWLEANVDEEARWLGETLIVELRLFPALADGIIAAGFTFERESELTCLRTGVG